MNHKTRWMLATIVVLGCGLLARPLLTPEAAEAQVPPGQAGPAQVGRYQLTVSNATLYFADTATGRVWIAAAETPKLEWLSIDTPVADAK